MSQLRYHDKQSQQANTSKVSVLWNCILVLSIRIKRGVRSPRYSARKCMCKGKTQVKHAHMVLSIIVLNKYPWPLSLVSKTITNSSMIGIIGPITDHSCWSISFAVADTQLVSSQSSRGARGLFEIQHLLSGLLQSALVAVESAKKMATRGDANHLVQKAVINGCHYP